MKKILASAYACEPGKGSEPGVGWNWIQQISINNQVWVFTRENNKGPINDELNINPNPNLHFVYVSVPKWLSFWKKGQRGIRTYYYLWQIFAYINAKRMHKEIRFDIGHHITFVNDWLWTFLCLMPIPYVWGPIGSHPFTPAKLISNNSAYFQERIRISIQTVARIIDPLYWLSAIRAKTIVAINNQTANVVPLKWIAKNKIIIEPAIGIESLDRIEHVRKNSYEIIFVGRFATIKAPHIAIDAFASFLIKTNRTARLTMIGDGPEIDQMESRLKKYNINDNVRIINWMERSEVIHMMSQSDVFLFPSMECGGMVVLEAMACGLPVVCLNYGGPGTMVTDECGYRINVEDNSIEEIISQLGGALYKLQNDEHRQIMSQASVKRVENMYNWGSKHSFSENIYDNILD